MDKLSKINVQQVRDESNVPKAWIKEDQEKKDKIVRPLVEIEVPEWFAQAEEIQEAERQRLNKLPVAYLKPS